MLDIQINEKEVEQRFLEEVRKRLDEIQYRCTFWDMKELCRQTNMSPNFIRETFFYDPRFPKYRVGKKWLFPARECEEFLLMWLKEQPRN
ncbi:group-specific protein [Thermaerobacillus caldiproteolyticus]|uniref:group-specific protein n=1 Tax=Thermaerobacillus caldiproteolyticus TaxID=247480 RepID=UPI0018F1CF97|nr:group-specific protein [Anoxybacillus caldiproteolyticus]